MAQVQPEKVLPSETESFCPYKRQKLSSFLQLRITPPQTFTIMTFKLTVLGSSSAVPTVHRHLPAQWLQVGKKHYLIDCGEGTQFQLLRYRLSPLKLDRILVSHLHADHILGLPGLLASMQLAKRTDALHIHGPSALAELLTSVLRCTENNLDFPVHFHATPHQPSIPEPLFEEDGLEVKALGLHHRLPCNAFLFVERPRPLQLLAATLPLNLPHELMRALKQGLDVEHEGQLLKASDHTTAPPPPRSYAHCSDTAYLPHLAEYLHGFSLLYHEATFSEKHAARAVTTLHSTARQAATLAKAAEVDQLLLGHFSARYDSLEELHQEALDIFPRTLLATDGSSYMV